MTPEAIRRISMSTRACTKAPSKGTKSTKERRESSRRPRGLSQMLGIQLTDIYHAMRRRPTHGGPCACPPDATQRRRATDGKAGMGFPSTMLPQRPQRSSLEAARGPLGNGGNAPQSKYWRRGLGSWRMQVWKRALWTEINTLTRAPTPAVLSPRHIKFPIIMPCPRPPLVVFFRAASFSIIFSRVR